jgi:hypothetical protein
MLSINVHKDIPNSLAIYKVFECGYFKGRENSFKETKKSILLV